MEEKHYEPAGAIAPYCSWWGLKMNIVLGESRSRPFFLYIWKYPNYAQLAWTITLHVEHITGASIPPGASKIKCVKNWPSAVFDLSRSRNIGKYRKLAKYWQITPAQNKWSEQEAFYRFHREAVSSVATFSTKLFTIFQTKKYFTLKGIEQLPNLPTNWEELEYCLPL